MTRLERFNAVLKHVYCEPKFVAQVEYMRECPGLAMQLEQQVGRDALEQFAAGDGWPDPDARVTLVAPEPIDFDWWEPRHDQPWRRQAARDRELTQRTGVRL